MHPHISRYHYNVEPFTEDALGNLSWGRLGNLILRCASLHAGEHGFGFDDMVKQGRVWVLSRLVIEMDEMPRTNDDLYIETWVGRAYRRFTDRHFSVMRADGTAYGHATSVWALIDLQTRQSADLEALPDGGLQPFVVADRPLPIAPPSRLPRLADSRPVAIHKAAFTDLDINGHVNSIRLLEMILDRFTLEELRQQPPHRIEMAYSAEGYAGDELRIYMEPPVDGVRQFEIRKGEATTVVKGSIR